jgi:tetratricopeptide (TPR) repeat protein
MVLLLAAALLFAPNLEYARAQAKVKEGQALMANEQFQAAAEAFREAIALDRNMMMAHYGLGQASMALKQYPDAVTAFRGARDAFHARAASYVTRSMENDEARDNRIRYLQDKIRENAARPLDPNSSAGRYQQARMQEWDIELSTLRRPSEDRTAVPTLPAGFSLALGSAHFRAGQLSDAEREYRAALDADPRLGEPRNNLAVVLLLTGRPAEAKEQAAIAEKNGFKVSAGLKKDIEEAVGKGPVTRNP